MTTKKIDVQSAGRLCLLRDLDHNAFAGIFYAATATMKAVIIACPEVKPQGVLAGQGLSEIHVCQGQVFCDRSYVGVTLTARRKVLLCLVPHLIGAHPLSVELVGDALYGDLHFRYFGVVKGLSVAREGLLRGDILEEHQDALHAAGGHVKVDVLEDVGLVHCHLPVPQCPVIQDCKAAFVLVVYHSDQLWQSDHVVLERYASDVV